MMFKALEKLEKIARGLGFSRAPENTQDVSGLDKSWSGGSALPPLPPSESTIGGALARLFKSAGASVEDAEWYIKHYKAQLAYASHDLPEKEIQLEELRRKGDELRKRAAPYKAQVENAIAAMGNNARGDVNPKLLDLVGDVCAHTTKERLASELLSNSKEWIKVYKFLIVKLEVYLDELKRNPTSPPLVKKTEQSYGDRIVERERVVSLVHIHCLNSGQSVSGKNLNAFWDFLQSYDESVESLNQENEAARERRRLRQE